MLSAEQVADYQEWFDNERKLRELIAEFEALGVEVIESDPRSKTRGMRRT
jgi:hypothetical protein